MKSFSIITLFAVAAFAFSACDEVDESDRFEGPVDVVAKKNVLIEDFTGQRCVNCPLAAEQITTIQTTYPENVIAVSIHGGSLSVSEETSAVGLATQQGQAYNDYWGVNSWPKGLVDRVGGLQDHTAWLGSVLPRLITAPKVQISVADDALSYDEATRRLTVTPTVTAEEAVEGKLQVWLTESKIVAAQYMPDGTADTAYEHNHVFRATLNDAFGDELTLAEGASESKTYTYTLADKYVADNCALVIFFYNETDGVMQVIEKHITTE